VSGMVQSIEAVGFMLCKLKAAVTSNLEIKLGIRTWIEDLKKRECFKSRETRQVLIPANMLVKAKSVASSCSC